MSKVKEHELPHVVWKPTPNHGQRAGAKVERVVLHTWGVHYVNEQAEEKAYEGVVKWFSEPQTQVSAHFVYPGSAKPNEITQMVAYKDYAWAEAAYNRTSVEIECADAIWQGRDPAGLEQLAHITGYLLHKFELKPEHAIHGGFCRHGDLGTAGGNHPLCPTADLNYFAEFAARVKANYKAGGYRKTAWGRQK